MENLDDTKQEVLLRQDSADMLIKSLRHVSNLLVTQFTVWINIQCYGHWSLSLVSILSFLI